MLIIHKRYFTIVENAQEPHAILSSNVASNLKAQVGLHGQIALVCIQSPVICTGMQHSSAASAAHLSVSTSQFLQREHRRMPYMYLQHNNTVFVLVM